MKWMITPVTKQSLCFVASFSTDTAWLVIGFVTFLTLKTMIHSILFLNPYFRSTAFSFATFHLIIGMRDVTCILVVTG